MKFFRVALIIIVVGIFSAFNAFAEPLPKLTRLSLEELMNLKITHVLKRPQTLSKLAASVFVINNEDIHRSGATTIPDLLRPVPGVQVGRVDANTWAVSVRGFNDRFSKLLVLMDGRAVWSPLFSGVLWNFQDTLFEDIDRIEVVKGPAGTVWGSNVLNGLVNIVTKSAKETQGFYVDGGYGSLENGFGDVRYGGRIGDNVYYRLYTKYYNRDNSHDGHDDWEAGKFGGRADWSIDTDNHLTIQGDTYNTGLFGYAGQTVTRFIPPTGIGTSGFHGPYEREENINILARGTNMLGRYTHNFSNASEFTVQSYYDTTYLDDPFVREARDTYDVDAHVRCPIDFLVPQELLLAAGYRYTSYKTDGSFELSFDPASGRDTIISWSAQDELKLIENFMTGWIGSNFEHNTYTGYEYQPTARLAIYLDSRNTIWGAITRAVRTPSRSDADLRAQIVQGVNLGIGAGTSPLLIKENGFADFKSRTLVAYEIGLKSQVTQELDVDIAAYYNDYNNLRSTNYSTPRVSGATLITTLPIVFVDDLKAETYGAEASVKYQVTENVKLTGGYAYLHIKSHPNPDINTNQQQPYKGEEEQSPAHQATGGVSLDLPLNLTFDTQVRYVGPLNNLNVPGYVATNMRLAWKPKKDLEISVVGLNLLEARHFEFSEPGGFDFIGKSTRAEPSVYAKVEAKF